MRERRRRRRDDDLKDTGWRVLVGATSRMSIADLLRTLPDCARCGALIPLALGTSWHGLDFCDMDCQQAHETTNDRHAAS